MKCQHLEGKDCWGKMQQMYFAICLKGKCKNGHLYAHIIKLKLLYPSICIKVGYPYPFAHCKVYLFGIVFKKILRVLSLVSSW